MKLSWFWFVHLFMSALFIVVFLYLFGAFNNDTLNTLNVNSNNTTTMAKGLTDKQIIVSATYYKQYFQIDYRTARSWFEHDKAFYRRPRLTLHQFRLIYETIDERPE